MASKNQTTFVIVGAGAAGLMAARELARASKRVIVLEARERCGGRIASLPTEEFGYPAEGGAEFVHGASPLTRSLMREAGLRLAPSAGQGWRAVDGMLSPSEGPMPHGAQLHDALGRLQTDLPVAEFLAQHFAEPQYAELRRSVIRMVEGFDAADPRRASTLALRDEWMGRGLGQQGRIAEGYGALISFLSSDCRRHGVTIQLGAVVTAIDAARRGVIARCRGGVVVDADAAILTVPLPLLADIAMPPKVEAAKTQVASDIGFGNVIKILLRFATRWWTSVRGQDLAKMSFVFSSAPVPTWWTQHLASHPVLTGWLAGPRADAAAGLAEQEIIELGLRSLAEIFTVPVDRLKEMLVASRAINWGSDPFARGAYSYATPQTREAQVRSTMPDLGVFFTGEAFYAGPEMGTVEAALASGHETARRIISEG